MKRVEHDAHPLIPPPQSASNHQFQIAAVQQRMLTCCFDQLFARCRERDVELARFLATSSSLDTAATSELHYFLFGNRAYILSFEQ
jgi:hypothetical protein